MTKILKNLIIFLSGILYGLNNEQLLRDILIEIVADIVISLTPLSLKKSIILKFSILGLIYFVIKLNLRQVYEQYNLRHKHFYILPIVCL